MSINAEALAKIVHDTIVAMTPEQVRDLTLGAFDDPPPEPEPYELIPEGRENAAVLEVDGIVGMYWRKNGMVAQAHRGGGWQWSCDEADVTSVTVLRITAAEAIVPREPSRAMVDAFIGHLDGLGLHAVQHHLDALAAAIKAGERE